jgi:hypothetical protein
MEECARTMRAFECPPIRSMRKEEKGGSEEVIVPGARVARENGSPPPNPLCFSVRPELVEGLTTNVFLRATRGMCAIQKSSTFTRKGEK